MQKLMANIRLRKPAADILPESFEGFLYIQVDTEHRRNALFTRSLLCAYVDSSDSIIADPDIIDDDGFPLRNNIRDPILLKDWTNRQRNRPLIIVVAPAMLCYA